MGKSKETRGDGALWSIGPTIGQREKNLGWSRDSGDYTEIFMECWKDQHQPRKNKFRKRGIKRTDYILAEGGHYACHTQCYWDCPTFLLNPLTQSYF